MVGPHPSRDAALTCKDCGEPPTEGGRRCDACRLLHNAREQARREERKRKRQCRVCGEKAIKDDSGRLLSTCQTHREYYRLLDEERRSAQ
jgi:hypothetical protein